MIAPPIRANVRVDRAEPTNDAVPVKPANRADSLVAITSHLGVNTGAAIADIGAGRGRDSWVFARIVGETGRVFAEEITSGMVDSLKRESKARGLKQIYPILGRTDDPCLPPGSVDFAYMNHVYHHFAKPRGMLRGIWRSLKPGGYLVIVDRRRGTLRDWVPRRLREKQHFWIAETTVVREAREEGFAFIGCAEDHWHSEDDFVLVFQRPKESAEPGHDPDAFLPLAVRKCARDMLPLKAPYRHPVFIALGEGRKLIPPILRHCAGSGVDVILEEWATQKDERPPLPLSFSLSSTLTQSGDPNLGPEPIDVVFFLDSYHLLFHGKTLLAALHERLLPAGCVYVLDRASDEPLSRREASHRRMIRPETVEQEMTEAGFHLWFRGPSCAPDRFLLVFGKAPPEQIASDSDPFIGGPRIRREPGRWLKDNFWRLRGVRTSGGKCLQFGAGGAVVAHDVNCRRSLQAWSCEIGGGRYILQFEQHDKGYVLSDCSEKASEVSLGR
jgi:SAM-dependent methyltransferase